MARLSVARAEDYERQSWKNGGGSTQEIARDPGSGLDGFGWRLSMAEIEASGGFSTFAGYRRVITVLEGGGMRLRVDGTQSRVLLPFDPFTFSGDSEVSCTLLGGAVRDLNLIYAPERYEARLRWVESEERLSSAASTGLVFSVTDGLTARVGDAVLYLDRHDSVRWDSEGGATEIVVDGACCVIELTSR